MAQGQTVWSDIEEKMSIREKIRFGFKQYSQFAIIGLVSGGIDLGSLNLLLYFWPTENSMMLTVFNTIAYALAVTNSYIWNTRFTFKHRASDSAGQIGGFVAQAIASLIISNLVFVLAVKGFGYADWFPKWLNYNVSKLLSMFLSSLASFFFMKFLVFKRKKEQEPYR